MYGHVQRLAAGFAVAGIVMGATVAPASGEEGEPLAGEALSVTGPVNPTSALAPPQPPTGLKPAQSERELTTVPSPSVSAEPERAVAAPSVTPAGAKPEPAPIAVAPDTNPGVATPSVPAATTVKATDGETPASEPEPAAPLPDRVVVATWGGAYGKAQRLAIFDPFGDAFATRLEIKPHSGRRDPDPAGFDVADIPAAAAERACASGQLLDNLDIAEFAADEGHKFDDFAVRVPGTCGVPAMVWSSLVAYDRQAFETSAPTGLAGRVRHGEISW